MASLFISNPTSLTFSSPLTTSTTLSARHRRMWTWPAVRFACDPTRRKARGLTVVTRAGPSTNTYVLALVLPLSLLAITVFTSIRIADRLDEQYLEELAINQALAEEDDEEEEDGDIDILVEEPALPRRNRPKREV